MTLRKSFKELVQRRATRDPDFAAALRRESSIRRKTGKEPNKKTIAAMREARAGKLPRFKSAKDLLRELKETASS
jgi:hypothetical protein